MSGSGEGVTSESDEEYQVGGSESDGDLSSAGEDGNDGWSYTLYMYMFSGTSLIRTPVGQKKAS